MPDEKYYIYIIRCSDNSLYTGIATDYKRRFSEHLEKSPKCAKYTLTHDAVSLEAVFQTSGRSNASKLEYKIKHIEKSKKEHLIEDPKKVSELFGEEYTAVKI